MHFQQNEELFGRTKRPDALRMIWPGVKTSPSSFHWPGPTPMSQDQRLQFEGSCSVAALRFSRDV